MFKIYKEKNNKVYHAVAMLSNGKIYHKIFETEILAKEYLISLIADKNVIRLEQF